MFINQLAIDSILSVKTKTAVKKRLWHGKVQNQLMHHYFIMDNLYIWYLESVSGNRFRDKIQSLVTAQNAEISNLSYNQL